VSPEQRRAWISTWAARWLSESYVIADRSEPVEGYLARAGSEPLDDAIAELCDVYLETDRDGRAEIRELFANEREFRQTLLAYVFRAASALRREPAVRRVRLGIIAIAIEDQRVDYRDSIVGLILLRWAAERVNLDPRATFESLADAASEKTGAMIRGIPSRSASEVAYTVQHMTARSWRDAFG
jgi:hypothetical protein